MADRPYTISEITQAIKQTLETEFPPVWVVGELSSYTEHASGHRYFTLSDDQCQLRCVMWRSTRMPRGLKPEVGMEVVARGRLTVYERSGQYQFVVQRLMQSGLGAAQLALEELKRRLHKEGLFDEARKRPLPSFPKAVGVVTSRSGAAIRDILQVLGRRFTGLRVVLRPTVVQGPEAPADVARGIAEMNAYGQVDVLIVGRGGGSPEDLAAFNTEAVVRAMAGSAIPVISAVGHEIDFTLADLVADVRAPTPSAAAEIVVRDAAELRSRVVELRGRLSEAMDRLLNENEDILAAYRDRYGLRRVEDMVRQQMQAVDELERSMMAGLRRIYESRRERYRRSTATLGTLSPLSVLGRGYSITQRADDGALVQDSASLKKGDRLRVRFRKGEALCRVDRAAGADDGKQTTLGY